MLVIGTAVCDTGKETTQRAHELRAAGRNRRTHGIILKKRMTREKAQRKKYGGEMGSRKGL